MKSDLPIRGGCACGNIRYECTAQPLLMFQCHCRDCQKAVGAAFAPNVWFPIADINFVNEPKSYIKKSDSGNTVHHEFCPDCGSPIGMRIEENEIGRGVRASSLDDPTWVVPDADIFMKNVYPWETRDSSRPSYDGPAPDDLIQGLIARETS